MTLTAEDLKRLYDAPAYEPEPRKPRLDPEVVTTWLAMMALILLFAALAIVVGIRVTDWAQRVFS